jgi:hypothetical protein
VGELLHPIVMLSLISHMVSEVKASANTTALCRGTGMLRLLQISSREPDQLGLAGMGRLSGPTIISHRVAG